MYCYKELKSEVFKENNQEMFLAIRDRAKKLKLESGVFEMQAVIKGQTGDAWVMMACVDRLAELGEIRELDIGSSVAGQNRIFK